LDADAEEASLKRKGSSNLPHFTVIWQKFCKFALSRGVEPGGDFYVFPFAIATSGGIYASSG
jgi:hypothetical protein